MDHQDVLAQLHRLSSSFDGDLGVLAEHLSDVTETLHHAVSGYSGLRLTVLHSGLPVILEACVAERVEKTATSLGIPLPLVSAEHEPGGRAIFYSTVPGALVDLAADLHYALDRAGGHRDTVLLDVDLPLLPQGPLLTGLEDLATLNRAVGFLIGTGQHPGTARQVLHRRAVAAGLTTLDYARRLLGH